MNRESAKTWLGRGTAATSEPALSSEDLNALLDLVSSGATVFDMRMLYRAAAEGWDWKANEASEYHGSESEIYKHCVERRKAYTARASGGGAVVKSADPASVKELL
jgi:hypothetical protein